MTEIVMPEQQVDLTAPKIALGVPQKAPVYTRINIVKPTRNRFLKALVFGPYGCGKTRFVCSANKDPRTMPALLLNFEGGQSSVADSGIDMQEVTDWDTYNEIFDYLSRGDHPYKSVLIDSITETHIFALFEILDSEGQQRRNRDHLEMGDYGTASIQLRRLIRSFRDLKMHVLITALDKEEVDAREGNVKKPALSGRLADEIPGIVDVVGYLALTEINQETHRVLVLQNYPKMRTKVRVPEDVFPSDALVDPSVTSLMDDLKYE